MTRPLRLSILDQTPVISGQRVADAVAATVDFAQAADDLGFYRYWCAEHHGARSVANPCPEVMIARLASTTKRMRIGSGGIMLPYYSSWKVAEQFLMLEALFPGRIDLGVGRAPGTDQRTARAVSPSGLRSDLFPQQVQELIWLFTDSVPEGHPYHGLVLQPQIDTRPELWMLGSSDFGGALAAHLGIPFCFAQFINAQHGDAVMQMYRDNFRPGYEPSPRQAVAIFVIVTDTTAEAEDITAAVDLRRLFMAYGQNLPVPTIEEAQSLEYSERDRQVMLNERPRSIIGTPDQVAERMLTLQEKFDTDELIILTVTPSLKARFRTAELLAETFSLVAA
jgi:luciferase family oxidoreductase group 1